MDYYKVLGLTRGASDDEVKQAYRKLAMKHHPDRGGDENEFKKIKEAYEAISSGQTDTPSNAGFRDFNDIFGMGKRTGGFRDFGFHWEAENVKNPDITISIQVTLEEAHNGFTKVVDFTTPEGTVKTITVTFPSGSSKDIKIRYAGEGAQMLPQRPPGDLYVRLDITLHPVWKINTNSQHDLITTCRINVLEAMFGKSITVKEIGGSEIEVTIPAGTQPGTQLRLKNRGLNIRGSSLRGNAFIKVDVEIPRLDPEDKKKLVVDILNKVS
jgi:curved DNA-binding protein